jgi:hypothetical protein
VVWYVLAPMSARPDVASGLPVVTALAGNAEFAMFEVVSFDGERLRVHTPFALMVGEELQLNIERVGRARARVVGHVAADDRQLTDLMLVAEP